MSCETAHEPNHHESNHHESNHMVRHDADVAIVGAGPVGTLLAILLGNQGKRVILIERWPTIYDLPRAVTMDHEVARMLATLGIDCDHDPAFEYHEELYYWKNAALEVLELVDWKSVASSGWRVTYWFNQPELEARLLGIAGDIPSVELLRGWEAVSLTQSEETVMLGLRETCGTEGLQKDDERGSEQSTQKTLTASYVVGCDGANSFVREALGIKNVDRGYFFDWLILDMVPNGDYQMVPHQWQLCDPERPTTLVPGGPGRRRWEFMLLPDECAETMSKPESAWALLAPWGLHPGNSELERSAVYRFQARWAEHWRRGRCLIAGDAAHLMPPFAGAGMCSGLRDAMGLGWRLNGILDGLFESEVLESYVTERMHHARHFVDFSQRLGDIICISDPDQAHGRDRSMKAALAERNHEPIKVDLVKLGVGLWCENTPDAGQLSTQGIVEVNGQCGRFDQLVGVGWMVVGFESDPSSVLTECRLDAFRSIGGRTVSIGGKGMGWDAVDVNGTYRSWMNSIDATWFIVRPDFYVAATARSPDQLHRCFDEIMSKLCITARVEK